MGTYHHLEDNKLKDNSTLAAHFIHSICHLALGQRKLSYHNTMDVNEFYDANREFLEQVVVRYRRERHYEIDLISMKRGIDWFLEFSVAAAPVVLPPKRR